MKSRPVLGLTMGDPAGIGPEICLRALREPSVLKQCVPVLFGDAGVVERVKTNLNGAIGTKKSGSVRVVPLSDWTKNGSTDEPLIVDCAAIDAGSIRAG